MDVEQERERVKVDFDVYYQAAMQAQ